MSPKTVLIVDDDKDFTDNLEDILHEEGYTVFSAGTCADALELAREKKPHAVILDLKLSDGSGTHLLTELKQLDPDCACIMATAYADLDSALVALERGVVHYLQKPVRPSDLLFILGSVFETIRLREEKREWEERVRESEEKYRQLVENANSIILRWDPSGAILYMNSYGLTFFGYSEEELIGRNVLGAIVPESESTTERDLAALMGEIQRDPERYRVNENENIGKDGRRVWVSWTNRAIFDEQGNLIEILSIGNDITEKKHLEAQLLHAQKMEAVGTLAGGIAHDFNNVLQAVQGYAELLLLDKKDIDPGCRELQMITGAVKRGRELTRQLLTFSQKIESNLNLVQLNAEVIRTMRLIERTIPKMIDIQLYLSPELKAITADPAQIEQVLMNLAVNAKDAMEEGGKLIISSENVSLDETFCQTRTGVKPGEYVLLTVSDTGRGMDRDTLERIFDPFFTTKGFAKGTGLGLAIVYGIIKNHRGHIECSSEPGAGTTFKIYLPAVEHDILVEEPTPEKKPLGGTETILLVDDDGFIRYLGTQLLTAFGYTVLTASDGEGALNLYRQGQGQIDLVILDLIMPGMSGMQCLEEILEINPYAKVIIASGYSDVGPIQDSVRAGAKTFVSKPYEMNYLLKVMREVLDQR